MAERVTRGLADHAFEMMINAAKRASKDTEGWTFGRPFGMYWCVTRVTRSGNRVISPFWQTLRQAYDGMDAMRYAFEIE